MAIKALKQSVSIRETQKMIHQWKAKGITDSATLKLLDLYLGLTHYMTAEGIYPMRNLYQICQSMKTTHTTTLLENIRKCGSFGLVWDENQTSLLGFYSPLWCDGRKNTAAKTADSVADFTVPVASPATTAANPATIDNSNIIYNNIYPPEDSRKGYSAGNEAQNPEETDAAETNPAKTPSETPDGGNISSSPSLAAAFFHRLNTNPEDKKRVLVPLIDRIATKHNYTRPRALQALVILVNQFLIPYFDSDPRFSRNSHTGRIIWLQNLMKTRHGQSLTDQAVARLGSELSKGLEEKRRKLREFRPVSPFEWEDPDKDIRYYDDPIDGKVEIPENAPPRPAETAIWNVLSEEWIEVSG